MELISHRALLVLFHSRFTSKFSVKDFVIIMEFSFCFGKVVFAGIVALGCLVTAVFHVYVVGQVL